MKKVSTVISYSSLEQRFIRALLRQTSLFCDDIIIVIYKTLLNGKPENVEGIKAEILEYLPTARIRMLDHDPTHSGRYHHNLARWAGAEMANYESILFLDGDEIPDGNIFLKILENNLLAGVDGADFACHWYFRNPRFQAIQIEHCGLLIEKKLISQSSIFSESERWFFRRQDGIKYLPMLSLNSRPFMHHFSWVRTKEEMLSKVSGWGHKDDKNWAELIREEFSRGFNGTDFVHNYEYILRENIFNIEIE